MAANGNAPFPADGERVVSVNYVPGSKDTIPNNHVEISVISGQKETQEIRTVKPGEDTLPRNASTEDLEKQERERSPMFYCKVVANYPLASFCKYSASVWYN